MSKIHYVWWGNPGTPALEANATVTPNQMVAAVHGVHDVHYWIGGTAAFNAPLDNRIIQHIIDPATLLDGTPLAHGNLIRFKTILDQLSTFRAFAACKDLVSFAVMYKEGGFFFDTTTVIGEGYHQLAKDPTGAWVKLHPSRVTNVARLLAGQPEIGAPYNPEGAGKTIYPGDETSDYTISYAAATIPPNKTSVQVPNFDVWALYSPKPHHQAFAKAVDGYMTRAQNIGIDTPGKKPMGSKTVTEIMNAADRSMRTSIIAGLSTTSLLEAFHGYAKTSGKRIEDLGWPFAKIDKGIIGTLAAPPTPANPAGTPAVRDPRLAPASSMVQAPDDRADTDMTRLFAGMEIAALTLPMIGIQKRFTGSWR